MTHRPPHSGDLRKFRYSESLALYFITKCLKPEKMFVESQQYDICNSFQHFRNNNDLRLHAFVIMPDHWHALLSTGKEKTLGALINQISRHASFRTRKAGLSIAWQTEYYDRKVRQNESALDIVRYIEGNPVRKGLVEHNKDWPWSSACVTYANKLDREYLDYSRWNEK